jgi:hypothetical protein
MGVKESFVRDEKHSGKGSGKMPVPLFQIWFPGMQQEGDEAE